MNWGHLYRYLANAYFTEILMQALSLTTILTYLLISPKSKSSRYLVIISIASFIEALFIEIVMLTNPDKTPGGTYGPKAIYLYIMIETICCSMYIRENIQSGRNKKLLVAGAVAFVACIAVFFLSHFNANALPMKATIVEGILIIIYCLYFFYELFTTKADKTLLKYPAFWAISGMLVLFSSVTPLFLFFDFLIKNKNPLAQTLRAINSISYSLLFITFIIALVCDRKQIRVETKNYI